MNNDIYENSIYNDAFMLLDNKCTAKDPESDLVFDRLTYIIFCTGLLPSDKLGKYILNQLCSIYLSVKDLNEEWFFEDTFVNDINLCYDKLKNIFPLKKGIKYVAKVLREQLVNEPFRNGIEFGVLYRLLDLSKTPYHKESLPFHSKIGLGYHAGRVATEERQLLEDAFFMLICAEKEYQHMTDTAVILKNKNNSEQQDSIIILSRLNQNVGTYCRYGIIGFFSFFEAYINGISSDYLYENEGQLSIENVFALRGKNKTGNHYLSIETKLEYLQQIIGGKVIYKTNNHQQLKDKSFQELLNRFKDVRDVSVHFAKGKGVILLSPQKWLNDIRDISKYTLDVSRKLWKACYPGKEYPCFLKGLKDEELYKDAGFRIENKQVP